MFKENVGKKQAGGLITTSNPPLIGSPTTALLPSAALPISTSTDLIENACLRAHNERRALHGASPLVWDDALVQSAQVWADHLAATGKIRHDPNLNKEGENIAWFRGHHTADCTDALRGWHPGFSPVTGHFTQVVWKATKAVGVVQASMGSGFSKQTFIVARYRPGGNIFRMFKENVGEKR
ncbi:Golgi-associated plant pathogenesis-related protein 1-like [Oculina patagonica]